MIEAIRGVRDDERDGNADDESGEEFAQADVCVRVAVGERCLDYAAANHEQNDLK